MDAEGVESGGLTEVLSGGCGEDVAKVASRGLRKQRRPGRRSRGAVLGKGTSAFAV